MIGRTVSRGRTGFDAGDIVIDGMEVGFERPPRTDIKDMIDQINTDVSTVTASAFNTVVAREVGTGIVHTRVTSRSEAQVLVHQEMQTTSRRSTSTSAASTNMDEMIANINASFS